MKHLLKHIEPTAVLRPFVRHYSVLSSDRTFDMLTFPLAYPQIIFHRKERFYIPELDARQCRFTISGQVNFPTHIVSEGNTDTIVAVFYPHTIGYFIDTPPSDFYNLEISGYDTGNKKLGDTASRIIESEDTAHAIHMLEEYLLSKVVKAESCPDRGRIGASVSEIFKNPSVSVEELSRVCCLCRKQFERVFRHRVGMNPKEYSKIVRFQKALKLMQNGYNSFSEIAYSAGYSDQSHFNREFRLYSGLSPSQLKEPTLFR